ncbi:VG15 protein [Corynebacterium amycolatum]|uniref:VG15 protein n=2 Tax=Corynebacterium amycolatum TaxID=43765 RepID=UPI001CCB0CAD|nr:hypothetical protein [Corynebacterium amycolatum]MCA0444383.1 hypothetical protein [Corynebacterium amycolatum]
MTAPTVDTSSVEVARRAVDWLTMRNQLEWVNRIAMQDLVAVFNVAKDMDPVRARLYLEQAMIDLVHTYGGAAGDLTADWWNDLAMDEMFYVPGGIDVNYEQLTKRVRWGTAPLVSGAVGDPRARLAGLLQQMIFGAQRDQVKLGTAMTRTGYARMAHPDACPFCRILASRGAVYTSRAAATYVGAAGIRQHYSDGKLKGRRLKGGRVRGTQKAGEKFHDHCRCVVAPAGLPNAHLELPDYYDKFEEEYADARAAFKDGTAVQLSDLTRVMRQQLKDKGVHTH